jgi:hypothetical protein
LRLCEAPRRGCVRREKVEVSPTLLNRDGKTADQSCGFFEGPVVLMFEESGEPLNTFVVAVKSRYVIDLSVSR